MAVRSYRKSFGKFYNQGSAVRQDILNGKPRELLTTTYAQKAATINRLAVDVDHHKYFFFKRIRTGRRCSCSEMDAGPSSDCSVCFNTGIVAGYEKFGTRTSVVDSTHSDIILTNIEVNYDLRPAVFKLSDSALKGSMEFKIDLIGNTGKMDLYQILSWTKAGTSVVGFVKPSEGSSWVSLSYSSLEPLLGNDFLWFKLEFNRDSYSRQTPMLSHFYFRYLLISNPIIKADVPRETQSMILSEFGIKENFSTLGMYFDNTLPLISNEDFLINLETNNRYKIVEVQDFVQGGLNTAWDAQARWINDYEPTMMVPM